MNFPAEFNRNHLVGLGFFAFIAYNIVDRICESSDKAIDNGMNVDVNLTKEGVTLSATNADENNNLSGTSDVLIPTASDDTTT